jgi:hypothetical protein
MLALITLPFVFIGGLMAFVITYQEMQHHFSPRRAAIEAAKVGLVAVVFLGLLSWGIAALVPFLSR